MSDGEGSGKCIPLFVLKKSNNLIWILPRGCMRGEAFNKQSHCYYESNAH